MTSAATAHDPPAPGRIEAAAPRRIAEDMAEHRPATPRRRAIGLIGWLAVLLVSAAGITYFLGYWNAAMAQGAAWRLGLMRRDASSGGTEPGAGTVDRSGSPGSGRDGDGKAGRREGGTGSAGESKGKAGKGAG